MADDFTDYPCDLCGGADFAELEAAARHSRDPIHICKACGFVQVIRRRSEEAIGTDWDQDIYGHEDSMVVATDPSAFAPDFRYTSLAPWSKARQVFAADFMNQCFGLEGKRVCDVGAGEGFFLKLLRDEYGAAVFGVEPSPEHCAQMKAAGIECFDGVFGQFARSEAGAARRFDVATMLWTIEASQSAHAMLDQAWSVLDEGGYAVIGTGSRILVPFKKPIHYYMSRVDRGDWHPFHFSYNTLRGMFAVTGFEMAWVNQYIDSDYMVMIGRKTDRSKAIPWEKDDWRAVQDYFNRWAADTEAHFAQY